MHPLFVLLLALLFLLVVEGIRILPYGLRAKFDGKRTIPYEQHPIGPTKTILCLGDSLGVGVGASTPEKSLFGRLGGKYPNFSITNYSQLGIKTKVILNFIKDKDIGRYDVIILLVGGMDIINFTPLNHLRSTLEELIPLLKTHGKEVFIILPKSTEFLPMYRVPISLVLKWRAKQIENLFREIGEKYGCFIIETNAEIFKAERKKYFARDKAHPNDFGYALWYEKISQTPKFKEKLNFV